MENGSSNFSCDDFLIEYFYSGRQYKTILERLKRVHGISKSMSWLKRQFRRLGLKKRCRDPPYETLKTLIEPHRSLFHRCYMVVSGYTAIYFKMSIINTSDRLRGYRAIWRIIFRKYKIPVRRDTVMKMMRDVDPEGVLLRKGRRLKRRSYHSKGPNHIWHLDGYDKLTPYGLSIHGCIDGKIIWLKLSPTNRDPKVVCRFYLEGVEKAGGCPKVVRADHGTENCTVAKVHIGFRLGHKDQLAGSKSFIYGPSTANIRIESWWSHLRRYKTNWWIDLCKTLITEGHYDHCNMIHRYTLAFTFGRVLQKDLDAFISDWNAHPIRRNRLSSSPHGCPDDIYDMPVLYGAQDQLQSVDSGLWASCMMDESRAPPKFFPDDFRSSTEIILRSALGLTVNGVNHENCHRVYMKLVQLINGLVDMGVPICSTLSIATELSSDTETD